MQICSMNICRDRDPGRLPRFLLLMMMFLLPGALAAQNPKFKSLKNVNVGFKNDALVKVMFTSPKEEYFYSTFRDIKIGKATVSRLDVKIRKADSVCVEVTLTAGNSKEVKKLMKQAKRDFGKPENRVIQSPTVSDWVWAEKRYPSYIESKSMHYVNDAKAEFKMILINNP
jgi:hypothetical protein